MGTFISVLFVLTLIVLDITDNHAGLCKATARHCRKTYGAVTAELQSLQSRVSRFVHQPSRITRTSARLYPHGLADHDRRRHATTADTLQ